MLSEVEGSCILASEIAQGRPPLGMTKAQYAKRASPFRLHG